MKRVVIDTNVFISGLGWGGLPFALLKLWRDGKIVLVSAVALIEEIDRVAGELGLPEELWQEWKGLIFQKAVLVDIPQKLDIEIADYSDRMFIECAYFGEASFIVSGDKHLLALKKFRDIRIVSARTFFGEFK